MSNVTNIKNWKKEKVDSKVEKEEEYSFEKVQEENEKRKEKLKKERNQHNKKLARSLGLDKIKK